MIFLFIVLAGFITAHLHANDNVADIVKKMSLEEKIGQLIMTGVPIDGVDPELRKKLESWHWHPDSSKEYARSLIERYHVGSVLHIMHGTIASQVEVTNYLNEHNPSSLPLLFAADFEPGLNFSRVKDAVPFPRAAEWGATGNETLLYDLGKALGHQARMMGVQVVFAPVVDIHSNPENPVINTRAFGTTAEKVIACAEPFMRGMQSEGVMPVIKHAPGHGNTKVDSHKSLPIIDDSLEQLEKQEMVPFKELIKRDAPAIMTAHLLVPAIDETLPTSLSPRMVKGILQDELGFKGIVFSDALNMRALANYGKADQLALLAFAAGTHQLVGPYDVPAACEALKKAVLAGDISLAELDERVAKIVRLKLSFPKAIRLDPEQVKKEVTSPEMYAVLKRLKELQDIENKSREDEKAGN